MYTLLIDTHFSEVLLVLFKNDKIIGMRNESSNQSHSIISMPLIKDLLEDMKLRINDISQIVVVNGPGSFTGVRIGVTIAKTISYCLNIPIKCISSLEVLASNIDNNHKLVAINDRNGYFIGNFDGQNKLIEDYYYISNKEFEEFSKSNKVYLKDFTIDYEKVYNLFLNKENLNPHLVNPIYVKKIEVQQ